MTELEERKQSADSNGGSGDSVLDGNLSARHSPVRDGDAEFRQCSSRPDIDCGGGRRPSLDVPDVDKRPSSRRLSLVVGSDVVDEILDSGGDEAGGDEELFNVRTVLCPNVVEHHEHDTRDEMSRNMLLPDTMLPPSMLLARSDMDDIVEEQVAYESKESEPSAADAAPRINRTLTMNAAAPRSANNAPGPFPFEDLTNTEAMVCQEELDVDIDESEDEEETRAVNIKPSGVPRCALVPSPPTRSQRRRFTSAPGRAFLWAAARHLVFATAVCFALPRRSVLHTASLPSRKCLCGRWVASALWLPNAVAAAAADPTLPLEFTSMMAADSDEEVGEDIAPDEVDLTEPAAAPHKSCVRLLPAGI